MVIALTEHLGQDVLAAGGRRLGRLVDLCARNDVDLPRVTWILVAQSDRAMAAYAWFDVCAFRADHVRLRRGAVAHDPAVAAGDVRLMRDVVDSQILDVHGRRIVRAADVELARRPRWLEVVGVDIGLASLLRRLGLRGLARRARRETIAWRDLEVAHGHELRLRAGHVRRRRYPHRRHRHHGRR